MINYRIVCTTVSGLQELFKIAQQFPHVRFLVVEFGNSIVTLVCTAPEELSEVLLSIHPNSGTNVYNIL